MAVELATAYVTLTTSTRGMGKDVVKQFGQIESSAAKTGASAGEKLKSGLTSAAKVAGTAVAGLVGAALVKGWGRLTAIENAQAKLKGLGHDAGSVQAIMDNALASVKGTSFGLDEAATTAAGAVAAGIKPGAELEKVLKSVANSSAAAGIGMDEMGGIYNKVASIGKAQNDVLQQVADRGIPIYQSLAEQLGVTTDEVFKMASKGQISFKQFQTAMTDASGTVADEMGKTTTGALSNLWAALSRFGAGILQGVFPHIAPLFTGLTEKVDGLAERVGPLADMIGGGLVAGFKALTSTFSTWAPILATVVGGLVAYNLTMKAIAIGTAVWNALLIAQKFATAGAAVQMRILNAAIMANPIGFIIGLITLLVAGFILAYQKVGWFRDGVNAAWAGIKFAVGAVVTWFQTWLMPTINTVLSAIGGFFTWLWKSVIVPVFNGIKFVISAWWFGVKTVFTAVTGFLAKVFGPAFKFFGSLVRFVFQLIRTAIQIWWAAVKIVFTAVWNYLKKTFGPVFQWLYNKVIKPVWSGIKTYISTVWAGLKIIFNAIVNFVKNTIQPRFNYLLATVKNVWAGIKRNIKTVWDFIKSKAFDPLANVVKNTLPSAFRAGKNAIGKAWDGLKSVAKKPVRFVVDTVINKGIIGNFNKIAKTFGADKIDRVSLPKGFATGGYTGAGSKYQPAGIVHADEYVIRKESQRKLSRNYGRGFLDHMNRFGTVPGVKGYAKGGKVGGGTLSDAARWLQKMGVRITEFKAWGQRVGRHSNGSLHYSGRAFDANYGPGGQNATEMAFFDRIVPRIHELFPKLRTIWRAAGHYNHLHVDTGNGGNIGSGGPGSGGGGFDLGIFTKPFEAIKSKVAGGVDKFGRFGSLVGSGAKKMIEMPIKWIKDNVDKIVGAVGEGVDFVKGGITKGSAFAKGQAWAAAKGLNPVDITRMNWIVSKESGWNPKAQNPRSTASGLPQFINSTSRAYLGGAPAKKYGVFEQLEGMHRYVNSRYGGWGGAVRFWKAHNYYSDGGMVSPTLFDKGGVLSPGTHLVANKTRRPEYILPAKVTDALMNDKGSSSTAPIIQVTTPVVERNEVDEWTEKVRFAFNHMSKTSAFSGVNG